MIHHIPFLEKEKRKEEEVNNVGGPYLPRSLRILPQRNIEVTMNMAAHEITVRKLVPTAPMLLLKLREPPYLAPFSSIGIYLSGRLCQNRMIEKDK